MHDEIGMTDQTDSKLRLTHQAPPPPLWTLQSGGSIVSILPQANSSCTRQINLVPINEIFRWRGYFFPIQKEIEILTFSMTIILANLSKHKHRVIQMILEHL